ncbi:MAG: hypothetical protein ACLU0O_08195 [Collinsella sp.]
MNFSYYVTGTLILHGVLLTLCMRLSAVWLGVGKLHKIPGKKLSTKKVPLTYTVRRAAVCWLLPVLMVNDGHGRPILATHLSAGVPRAPFAGHRQRRVRSALGHPYWKLAVLIAVVVLSVLFYRPFCKWI